MIKDRNFDPTADTPKHVISLNHSSAASLTAAEAASVVMPFTGKILTLTYRCSTMTDADDGVRVDVFKGVASILAAAVDPVAAATTTVLTATTTTFVAGDVLSLVVTTGAGDALVGSLTIVARPYIGAAERFAAKAAGIVITP